jgi:hypothetical protein
VSFTVVEVSAHLFQNESHISLTNAESAAPSKCGHAALPLLQVQPLRCLMRTACKAEIYLTTVLPSLRTPFDSQATLKRAHSWLIAAYLHYLLFSCSAQQIRVYSGLSGEMVRRAVHGLLRNTDKAKFMDH